MQAQPESGHAGASIGAALAWMATCWGLRFAAAAAAGRPAGVPQCVRCRAHFHPWRPGRKVCYACAPAKPAERAAMSAAAGGMAFVASAETIRFAVLISAYQRMPLRSCSRCGKTFRRIPGGCRRVRCHACHWNLRDHLILYGPPDAGERRKAAEAEEAQARCRAEAAAAAERQRRAAEATRRRQRAERQAGLGFGGSGSVIKGAQARGY